MRKPTTRLVPWVGGKGQLMWAIQMLLPIHYKTLVDVFGGSGIITLPVPACRSEVLMVCSVLPLP